MAGKMRSNISTPSSTPRDNLPDIDRILRKVGQSTDFKAAALLDRGGKILLAYRMSAKDMASLNGIIPRLFGSVEIGRGIFGLKVESNNGTTVISKRISNGMYLAVCLTGKAYTALAMLDLESCAQNLEAILPQTHYSLIRKGDAS